MAKTLELDLDRLETPIGDLLIAADQDGRLRALDWRDHQARMHVLLERHYGKRGYRLVPRRELGETTRAIRAYFSGDLGIIDSLPVAMAGTPFQNDVWRTLRTIPHGKTISYAELARRVGRPRAVRAAGFTNGQNPISIVIPCHRVIGSDGTLTGYGGGLPRKKWLLEHEGAIRRGS